MADTPDFDAGTIRAAVYALVAETLGIAPGDLPPTARLSELSLESVDVVEICLALEEAFDVEVNDEDAESIVTLDDLVRVMDESARRRR